MFNFIKNLFSIDNTNNKNINHEMTSNHFRVQYHNSPKKFDYRCPINMNTGGSWDVINISEDLNAQKTIFNEYLLKEIEYHAYVGSTDIYVRFYSKRRDEYIGMSWRPGMGICFFSFMCYDSGTRYDVHYSSQMLFKMKDMLLKMEEIIMNEYNQRKNL